MEIVRQKLPGTTLVVKNVSDQIEADEAPTPPAKVEGDAFAGMTSRIVRALFLCTLREYFKGHAQYTWSPDESKSKITLRDYESENARLSAQLPAIIVDSAPGQFVSNAIGNLMSIQQFPDKPYLLRETLQFEYSSAINMYVICETSIESEEIANELALFFTAMRTKLSTIVQLQTLSMASLGRPSKHDRIGADYVWMTPIQMQYTFARSMAVDDIDSGKLIGAVTLELMHGRQRAMPQ